MQLLIVPPPAASSASLSKWLVWNFAGAGGDALLCFSLFEHHLVVYRQEYHRYHHANCRSSRNKMHIFLLAGMER